MLRGQKRSAVWNYFEIIEEGVAKCSFCGNDLSFRSSVSNLRKHLRLRHLNKTPLFMTSVFDELDDGVDQQEEDKAEEEGNEDPIPALKVFKTEPISSEPIDTKSPIEDDTKRVNKALPKLTRIVENKRNLKSISYEKSRQPELDTSEENEFVTFGRTVGRQLQQLPLEDALELQVQIQTIISQRRLKVLRKGQLKIIAAWSINGTNSETSPDPLQEATN